MKYGDKCGKFTVIDFLEDNRHYLYRGDRHGLAIGVYSENEQWCIFTIFKHGDSFHAELTNRFETFVEAAERFVSLGRKR